MLFRLQSRRNKQNSGFSLVELLVVVAILAILAAIAIPLFLNQKDKATTANIKSDMHTIIVEMETLRNSLAPGASYTNATQIANFIVPVWPSSATGIIIVYNCTVNDTVTTAASSPGNYVILGLKPAAPNAWDTPWSGGGWVYNSATSKWYGPFAATPAGLSSGVAGPACGNSAGSGGAYFPATK